MDILPREMYREIFLCLLRSQHDATFVADELKLLVVTIGEGPWLKQLIPGHPVPNLDGEKML